MALPVQISTTIAALAANATASQPLESASRVTIKSLQLDAATIVRSIDAALASTAGALDTFEPGDDPDVIAAGVAGLLTSAQTQASLSEARGLVGRVASNLGQL